ncbi:hypothetical protein HK100_006471 [Physocladia obscura]|uniref:Transcription initiation factor TFIID subunit 9 n=1 Tax=Physocladia obscura TaxID=109957 RepID=A0AAD5TFD9_9FUNG|nr:hypothetical protein HK100_006471 [Physocladia obscura]
MTNPLQSAASANSGAPEHQDPLELPRNAKIVSLLMHALDVPDYEPAVLPQLLEFMHRYVIDVVNDAQLFAEHAGKTDVDADDVRLAVEGKLSHSFTGVPSKEVLSGIAEVKNSAPLPFVSEKLGLRLPPERNSLTGLNFQIIPKKPVIISESKNTQIPATAPPSAAAPLAAANPSNLQQAPSQSGQQQFQFQQQFQPQQIPMISSGFPAPPPFMFGGMGAAAINPGGNSFQMQMLQMQMNMQMGGMQQQQQQQQMNAGNGGVDDLLSMLSMPLQNQSIAGGGGSSSLVAGQIGSGQMDEDDDYDE